MTWEGAGNGVGRVSECDATPRRLDSRLRGNDVDRINRTPYQRHSHSLPRHIPHPAYVISHSLPRHSHSLPRHIPHPAYVISHSLPRHIPLPPTSYPTPPRHSRPCLRHSREGGNLPAPVQHRHPPGAEFDETEPTYYHEPMTNPDNPVQTTTQGDTTMQSPICNQQFSPSRPRQESTQSYRMRPNAAKTRARTREAHHSRLLQEHSVPPTPTDVTPTPCLRHSRTHPRHSRTLPRHSRTLPRHSREGGNPDLPPRRLERNPRVVRSALAEWGSMGESNRLLGEGGHMNFGMSTELELR